LTAFPCVRNKVVAAEAGRQGEKQRHRIASKEANGGGRKGREKEKKKEREK
jgi:hypothetical protein